MSKINVPVEIPESIDSFLKLLPLSIRKKYMSGMTSAIIKENEKEIIANVTGIVQEIMLNAISGTDEAIMQEELDKGLADIGVTMSGTAKKITGKKKKTPIKKEGYEEEEIHPTILKEDVKDRVDFMQSDSKASPKVEEMKKSSDIDNKIEKESLVKETTQDRVKKLDLNKMFEDK